MDTNQQLWAKMCMLLVWSALMLRSLALIGDDDVKTTDHANVVDYWETKLPTAIPSSIRAMVTPLSSQQTIELLINITTMTRYFPTHAATFCKTARISLCKNRPMSNDPSSKNLIPLYHQASKNLIPLYHSDDLYSKNLIPLYHSNDLFSKNLIPLYHSDDLSSKNLIPLYHSDDSSSKNLIPLYHSNDPSSKNLIPLYHSDDPYFMQNGAFTKKPNKARSQALDRISSKFTKFRHSLISPTVHEVQNAFREKQVLVSGKKIYIDLASDRHGVDERAFLPRKLARLFPFDNEGSKIESMLEISKESLLTTIHNCKAQIKNDYLHTEVKACLTSLEDVVDFVTNIMGSSKPIKVYDSLFNASSVKFVGKTFTVLNVESLKQDPDEASVSCHDMDFPFRVFYCHYVKQTKNFVATLQAEDGSIHERIVNCHYDTSYWNPQHVAFRELQTRPGEGEICHWLGKTWMEEDGWLFLHA